MNLSLGQKIKLLLSGYVYVGHETRSGWSSDFPFYAFRCPTHGLVKSRPYGFTERLECPHCGKLIKFLNDPDDIL